MGFSPKTFKDALSATMNGEDHHAVMAAIMPMHPLYEWLNQNEEIRAKFERFHRHGLQARGVSTHKIKCDGCSRFVHDFVLIDCSSIKSLKQDFVCDGCWTNWDRTGMWPDGSGFTLKRWFELHGADAKAIEHAENLDAYRDAVRNKYKKKIHKR